MEDATKLILEIYLWFCVVAFIAFLPRISYYFFGFVKQKRLVNNNKNKIAVIIPARNEIAVISHCLDSLAVQTYDPQYFDIHIVVHNETDPAIDMSSNYERTYVTVISEHDCKGEALDGILKKILNETPDKYDAFLLLDADNLATPDLLEEMNNALGSGKQIICGKKLIKNWQSSLPHSRSFISNCTALTYAQVDELGNRARNIFGMTITMIGTGMLIRTDVIKENNGWPYRGLTEDYEMTADAIVKGWTSMYYTHARVYTEEATDAKTAFKRKMRWIKGYSQCQRRAHVKILKDTFSKGFKWRNIDFLYSTYPAYSFFAVSVIAMIYGMVAVGFSVFDDSVNIVTALQITLLPLLLIYAVLFAFTLMPLIADWRNIKIPFHEKMMVLFFNPMYMFAYFRIFIVAFFTSYDYFKWESTDRVPFEPIADSE